MGLFKSNFVTVKVRGSLRPTFGKNVEEKKMEKIEEMEDQGYTLVNSTGQQLDYGNGLLGGLFGDKMIEYTLVFRKPGT